MEVIFLVIAGFVVFIIAVLSIIRMVTHRVAIPAKNLEKQITNLEHRINELENEKNNHI